MRSLAILVLAGCVASSPGESPEFVFRVGVSRSEPLERPPADPQPVVYINGAAGDLRKFVYDSVEVARTGAFDIELRYGDLTVAKTQVRASDIDCLRTIADPTSAGFSFCEYDSGDLRYSAEFASHVIGGVGQTCSEGDGACAPRCDPATGAGCATGTRCTSRVAVRALASRLACAPIGPKALGEACALIADPEGDYDDCGGELLCVDGACRRVCSPSDPASQCTAPQTCSWVPGHAPEMRVCL